MKNISHIDAIFLAILGIFSVLWVYEIVDMIQPYYEFRWAFIIFLISLFVYYVVKNGGISFVSSPKSINQLQEIFEGETYMWKMLRTLKQYRDVWVYGGFLFVYGVIICSLFINTWSLLQYSVWIFCFVYLIAKLLGFQLDFKIPKSHISNTNTLRFFLISLGLFIIVLTLIFNSFEIDTWVRWAWYILLSWVYVCLWMVLFFSWNIRFHRLVSPYNIFSGVLILSLLGFLAFQNGFLNFSKTPPTPPAQQAELVSEPVIAESETISDEVEIAYETRLVSQAYFLSPWLQLGSSGDQVKPLQEVLLNLGYFNEDIDGEFDEWTRLALVEALRTECSWPESTSWIFGSQALSCINDLEISLPVDEPTSWETEALSEQEVWGDTEPVPEQDIQTPGVQESEIQESTVIWEEEVSYETQQVSQVYTLIANLRIWSEWPAVSDLQRVLGQLQYYTGEVSGEFDEGTSQALIDTLKSECSWPESTRGIFWPLAKECIDSLEIPVLQEI